MLVCWFKLTEITPAFAMPVAYFEADQDKNIGTKHALFYNKMRLKAILDWTMLFVGKITVSWILNETINRSKRHNDKRCNFAQRSTTAEYKSIFCNVITAQTLKYVWNDQMY